MLSLSETALLILVNLKFVSTDEFFVFRHGWNPNHISSGSNAVENKSNRPRLQQQTSKVSHQTGTLCTTRERVADQAMTSTKKYTNLTKKTANPTSTTQRKNLPPIESFLPQLLSLKQQ